MKDPREKLRVLTVEKLKSREERDKRDTYVEEVSGIGLNSFFERRKR